MEKLAQQLRILAPLTTKLSITERTWLEMNWGLVQKFMLEREGTSGVSGSFTTTDGKTITVVDGMITEIV